LMADCSTSGATTRTSPNSLAAFASTLRPGLKMPSSLLTSIRMVRQMLTRPLYAQRQRPRAAPQLSTDTLAVDHEFAALTDIAEAEYPVHRHRCNHDPGAAPAGLVARLALGGEVALVDRPGPADIERVPV